MFAWKPAETAAHVVLTERGRAKADEARPLWVRAQRRFEGKVGAAEAQRLRRGLSRGSLAEFADRHPSELLA
jgi:hypothetical protein